MLDDAQRLTPGGVGGIRRPYNFVVGEYPVFITHGHGGHIVDVDGNEYIDMLCAYGPIILGYVEDEINDAAKAQMDKGFCFSLVQPLQNELEQRLADIMPCGEQTILVKTGSDATNAAVRAMRAYTGRDKIARCGYHGWGDWCVEHHGGVPQAVSELTKEFEYGDIADLERVFAENPDEIAGVIITPVGHPMAKPIIAPPPGYLQAVVDLAHKHGAVVTFDEIRTGFRVSMGGASERYGVTPDLTTVGKAMANGYSIAALVGRREVMSVYVKDAFLSSTYFPNSLEMAASMKCLEILEREKVQDAIWERGTRFLDKLGAHRRRERRAGHEERHPADAVPHLRPRRRPLQGAAHGVLHAVHPPRPLRAAVSPLVHLLPPHRGGPAARARRGRGEPRLRGAAVPLRGLAGPSDRGV